MSAITLAFLVLTGAACGAAGPPHGPDYTPANSPEAETGCPKEAAAAKVAREEAIGDDGLAPGETAAKAVFALAECERARFDLLDIDSLENPEMVAGVRRHMSSVRTLYEEAMSYHAPRWVIGSLVRSGDVVVAYATKVRKARPPTGVTAPEVDDLARELDAEAVRAYLKALDAADTWPNLPRTDAEVRRWIDAACAGSRAQRPVCHAGL